jgi:sec-independent protein translocase protein TatA
MFGLGITELVIICAIFLLLFGMRVPRLMRSLGRSMFEFKEGVQGLGEDSSHRLKS